MKTNTLRSLGVSVAALIAAGWWYFSKEEEPRAQGPLARALAAAQRSPDRLLPGKNPPLWPKFGTPEFNERIADRARAWLDSRGRDAAGLITVWDLTGNPKILDEALTRFPDDPRVCMAMIESAGDDPQKSLPWIEILIAAAPDDSAGHHLKSRALLHSGDRKGTLTALQAANVCADSSDRTRPFERIRTLREAAGACGLPAPRAELLPVERFRHNPNFLHTLAFADRIAAYEFFTAVAAHTGP
jgi:hypothetical protein